MITLDGRYGEGGGQILRTALCLSMITQTPFEINHIRAKRSNPGLKHQHLTCVKAAQRISNARVEGDALHSSILRFYPQDIVPGDYSFEVPTAGSSLLVLQAILPALVSASGPSKIDIGGGTHNSMSPPFDYIQQVYIPCLEKMGPQVELSLLRPGFFPKGGGKIRAEISPAKWKPLHLPSKQNLEPLTASIFYADIPDEVALKAREKLQSEGIKDIELCLATNGPGFVIMVKQCGEYVNEIATAFGEKKQAADRIVSRVLREMRAHQKKEIPVGEHLADQLLLAMVLAGEGSFYTGKPTKHTLTNIHTIQAFLKTPIQVLQDPMGWQIRVG